MDHIPAFKQRYFDALCKLNERNNFNYFEVIARGVKFKNYVGIIQVDNLIIEVLPKIDKYETTTNWKNLLIQMLKATKQIKAHTTGYATAKRQNLNLIEVYFELFLKEVESLTKRGLIKKYRKKTGNISALKGRLEFAGNISRNMIHKERFYTTHQTYDYNHLINQILIHALGIIENLSKGNNLLDRCKRALFKFPEIDRHKIDKKQLQKIFINRKTKPYEDALLLAKLIILNYSPDISAGNVKMISLLFDMNKLWEDFVLTQLKKELSGSNYEVKGQDKQTFIGSNYLKPDIVIQNKSNKKDVFIIDTKWKHPVNKSSSISDLRQIYAYSRFWKAKKAMLLYPGSYKNNEFKIFETDDFFKYDQETIPIIHMCKSGYINITNKNDKLNKRVGKEVLELLEEDFS